MYSSIATVCLSGSFREKLAAIAHAGFEGVRAAARQNTADSQA